jgi:hypothetical protein
MTKSNLTNLFKSSRKESANEAESLADEAQSLKQMIQGKNRPRRKGVKADENVSPIVDVFPSPVISSEEYKELWLQHEIEWRRFSSFPPREISFSNVPFPPCDYDVLEFTSSAHGDLHPSKAYHIACLRYHPDKFMQQFGQNLVPSEAQSIISRLTSITQSINSEWEMRKKSRKFRRFSHF